MQRSQRRPHLLVALTALAVVSSACQTRPAREKARPTAATARPATPSPAAKPAPAKAERPKIGSPVRTAIMDALRTPVEKELKQPVKFLVGNDLKVAGGWAFLTGQVVTPAGKPIDFHDTRYEAALKAGAFDDGVFALLEKTPTGAWRVEKYRIGCTDVCWEGWQAQYGAPASVFP